MSLIVSCALLLTGCGAKQQDTATAEETESASYTEEGILPDITKFEIPEEIPQKLTETDLRVFQSLVGVRAGDLQGSGVIYDENEESMLIVTAGHVLEHDTGELLVTLPDETVVAASGIVKAKNCDLAFLWVDKADLTESTRESCLVADTDRNAFDALQVYEEYPAVTTDRERFDHLEVYEDVWMYGDTSGQPVYAFVVEPWIYVEDFTQYMLLLQGLMEPGMSGGGAFTEDGVFLGILCGADEEGKVAVVPYSIIESERAGLDNP